MAFPFPDDRIGLSRLNWCRAGTKTDSDGLSCVLRARMCADHVQSTNNEAWAAASGPAYAQLLASAQVKSWSACPEGDVSGVCGMLLTDRYAPALWEKLGHGREKELYKHVQAGTRPDIPVSQPVELPRCNYPNDVLPAAEQI